MKELNKMREHLEFYEEVLKTSRGMLAAHIQDVIFSIKEAIIEKELMLLDEEDLSDPDRRYHR